MSKFTILFVFAQALLIQNAYSQCIQTQQLQQNLAGLNLNAVNNAALYNNANVAANNAALYNAAANAAYNNAAANAAYNNVALNNAAAANVAYGGGYGGSGTGEIAFLGDLPIGGSTVINGNLPVIGVIQFDGSLPASGLVSLVGNTPCQCGYTY